MPKPVLGRGLGTLMAPPKSQVTTGQQKPESMPLTPGVAALLKGGRAFVEVTDEPPKSVLPRERKWPFSKRVIQASLVLADIFLLVLVAWLSFSKDAPKGPLRILLCALALIMGAWLAFLALWLEYKEYKHSESEGGSN